MDTNQLAEQLSKVPAGYLPAPLFNQIARLGVSSFLELVALRMNGDAVEVVLTKRDEDDEFSPVYTITQAPFSAPTIKIKLLKAY